MDANRAPVAKDEYYTMRFGEQFRIKAPGPLKNDTDPDGPRPETISIVSAPAGVTAAFTDDGQWFTVACSASNPCSIGQLLTIKYQAVDRVGAKSNVATMNIQIIGNRPGTQAGPLHGQGRRHAPRPGARAAHQRHVSQGRLPGTAGIQDRDELRRDRATFLRRRTARSRSSAPRRRPARARPSPIAPST